MLAHQYQIWQWGGRISKPGDSVDKYNVGVVTQAKRDANNQFEVFNELLGTRLATLVGLPVPPGFILNDNGFWFASMRFSILGVELPDGDSERLVAEQPFLACGIVVFDSWIANADRHSRNFFYDCEDKKVWLFDHGRALLDGVGVGHLEARQDGLGISTDDHDIMSEITSLDDFDEWMERIGGVSDRLIMDAASEASEVIDDKAAALACGRWLIQRKGLLKDIFKRNLGKFPKYSPGMFNPFRVYDDPIDYYI